MNTKSWWAKNLMGWLGCVLYSCALNLIIIPYGLYSGTFTGVAQMLNAFFVELLRLPVPEWLNLTGILLMLLNLPLLLIAFKDLSRSLFWRTMVIIGLQMTLVALVPVPKEPLLDNELTACIVGGLITGFGAGLTLRSGASSGGTDLLGIILARRFPRLSVGKISLIVGAFVLTYCAFRYDMNIVVYSAVYTVVLAITMDRAHYQNITTSAMIFTKKPEVLDFITKELRRGATCWKGFGAYTNEESYIYMTVISKYEMPRLKQAVKKADPQAFIIFTESATVTGNFERRLVDN